MGMAGRAAQTTIAFSQLPPPVFLAAATPPRRADSSNEGFPEEQEQNVGKMEGRRWFEDEREVHAARREVLVSGFVSSVYDASHNSLLPNAARVLEASISSK